MGMKNRLGRSCAMGMKNRPEGVLKIGDVVKLTMARKVSSSSSTPLGIIVERDLSGWLWVSQNNGTLKLWPESQMEIVVDSHVLMPDDLKGNEL